jgi:hypothetical protein
MIYSVCMQNAVFLAEERPGCWVAEDARGLGAAGAEAGIALSRFIDLLMVETYRSLPSEESLAEWQAGIQSLSPDACIPISLPSFQQLFQAAVAELPKGADEASAKESTWWSRFFFATPQGGAAISNRIDAGVLRLKDVRLYPHSSCFKRQRLLEVTIHGRGLHRNSLPIHYSSSLFSFSHTGLACLTGCVENLSAALRAEDRGLNESDASSLAYLVSESIGWSEARDHYVITCEALKGFEEQPLKYDLDRKEFNRIESQISAPVLSLTESPELEFTTLAGKAHYRQEVVRWRVEISSDFEMNATTETISHRIFSRISDLIY